MKHFQPCPLCGNCQSYRRSVKIDKQVIQPAGCAKKAKPVAEGTEEKTVWICKEFGARGKKGKRMSKRMKKWERQFSY